MEITTDAPDAPIGVPKRIRANEIDPGNNPRPESEFDPNYITELAESFKALGMLQWPVVRLMPDGRYQLVAGECRVRGWREAFGEDAELDVIVTDKDDKAWLDAAAVTENVIRRAMSSVAEAEGAARMLGHCSGDREEAAKRLGWSRSTLDSRLALMYATPEVRKALHEKRINLGHAELLAVLRKEVQNKGLELLLGQGKLMSVADFKAHLERSALVLDTAIFEKSECAGCHHNTSNQSTLFAETISGGKCSNKQCFDAKTEAELEKRSTDLKERFQVVRIARAGENFTIIPLVAEGAKGVGAEQAQACQACKSFGAVVSAVPDKLGIVYENMCMDVPCNTKMVAARINAAKATPDAGSSNANSATPTKAGGTQPQKAGAAKAGTTGGNAKPAAKASVKYPEPSNRVKEYRERLWRAVFQRHVMNLDVQSNRSVLLALVLTNPSVLDKIALQDAMKDLLPAGASVLSVSSALKVARELTAEQLGQALKHIAANTQATSLPIADVVAVLESFDVKLADHWKVKKEFFELLTKNEIDHVCKEIGVAEAMGDAYAKAFKERNDDYIKAILTVKDFEYQGRVPKLVRW
jgi:ParB family chromosome partitioning protein